MPDDPIAIEGTWSDIESHARYIYWLETATQSEHDLAEAVLVLLGKARDAERSAATRQTISAIGPHGRSIFFDDLVSDGEVVAVRGRRMVVYYDPDAPDWFVEDEQARGREGSAHGLGSLDSKSGLRLASPEGGS